MAIFLAGITVFLSGVAIWARRDFNAWKVIGPGGLPHTLAGWCRMTYHRVQMTDGTRVENILSHMDSMFDKSFLDDSLPRRIGVRPDVAPFPIPQRQMNQRASALVSQDQEKMFNDVVNKHVDIVHYKLSFYEKHNMAVTLLKPELFHSCARQTKGEIGHIHPSDGSMHMILSPGDTKEVIEKGWGELHGLAGKCGLPATYLFVYAARDGAELEVLRILLQAAIRYMNQEQRGLEF